MAKNRPDAPQPDPNRQQLKKSADGLTVAILVGVVVLIVISGMNLYETRQQRTEFNERMAQLVKAVGTKPASPEPRATGPDRDKVYTVKTEGSPALGPGEAPITIAEFSDFQ